MPQGPAARVGDPVAHPLPPVLGPGPGSTNVLIGNQPAWRGMPLAAAAGVMSAKAASDATVVTAMAASTAAMGTPGAPAAKAAEVAAEQAATASMTSAMSAAGMGADQHMCSTPLAPPLSPPPHSMGMVTTGSLTVLINNLPACRMGDTILECLGPPNTIAMGFPTVMIGDSMYVDAGGAMAAAAQAGAPFVKVADLNTAPKGLPTPSSEDLSKLGSAPGKGDYTKAGHSLSKHAAGKRVGSSAFPDAKGNPAQINQQAKKVLDDILNDPNKVVKQRPGRPGEQLLQVHRPDGSGVMYKWDGAQ